MGTSSIAAEKPNIIYILADDLGYGEVGYNGQKLIQTPELDQLAEEGMRFTNHYCGNSVCAPSRCSLVTGLHPGHAYIRANSPGYPNGQTPLPKDTETIGKLMQRAGYQTAIIGKWGLGSINDSGNPNLQGFDYFFGYTDQRQAHNYYPKYLWRNSKKIQLNNTEDSHNDYSHDLFTEEALEFIVKNKGDSFFLYLAYTIPHVKYQVPDLAQYKDKDWPKNMKIHAAMTSRMDRDIGTIKRRLEKLGIAENTLIIFNSDNGAHGSHNSKKFFNISGQLKGIKRTMYEGGVRSPMIAYWPKTIAPNTVSDHLSAFWDMLPTFSEISGESIQGKTDGISMLPTFLGKTEQQKKHKFLYWELYEKTPNQAVRFDKWKGVVVDRRQGNTVELYDLSQDEGERSDQAQDHPEIVDQIKSMMEKAHIPNPYWDKNNKPLFNVRAAKAANKPSNKGALKN